MEDDADVEPAFPVVYDDVETVTFASRGRPEMKVSTLYRSGIVAVFVAVTETRIIGRQGG